MLIFFSRKNEIIENTIDWISLNIQLDLPQGCFFITNSIIQSVHNEADGLWAVNQPPIFVQTHTVNAIYVKRNSILDIDDSACRYRHQTESFENLTSLRIPPQTIFTVISQ